MVSLVDVFVQKLGVKETVEIVEQNAFDDVGDGHVTNDLCVPRG